MKSSKIVTLIILLSAAVGMVRGQGIPSGALKVGAAREIMNPPASIFTASADQFRRFSGIHDSLLVRSIVIDNGFKKVALVSMDISKVPGGARFIQEVAAGTKIPQEDLFIAATHDHNTIQLPANDYADEYYNIIKNATIKSINAANAKLQPAKVGFAKGKAYINTNRDEKIGEGYHMGYNPDGPSDKTVAVVSFTTLSGEPIAIYANYAVHAVVMYRASTKDGLPEISADLPGATAKYVDRHFKNAVTVWTSGAAGDQNPMFMSTYNQDHPDTQDEGIGGYAILDVQARRLGEEIVRLVKSIKNTDQTAQIWSKKTSVTCEGQERKYPRKPEEPRGGYLAPTKVEMVDGDPVTIPLHLLMINDIALAGVAAEVFTEIGMHLKETSRFDRTMMVTVMANAIGYVPTDAAYLMPSEKALGNSLKPGCAEPAMIDAFVQLMDEYIALKQKSN
ncbi:hypothetical protein [uncultured Imperialibacter sp.]|uniref:hypothetical protein n=1 Tax=uncultured Imperialibacter sp. TaxID=1672639 RepID=UPI0030DAA9A1|tara:strand:+ start:2499 stop:3848 length:1350 start_codon:yes stop_codon:yes gene_type:complete